MKPCRRTGRRPRPHLLAALLAAIGVAGVAAGVAGVHPAGPAWASADAPPAAGGAEQASGSDAAGPGLHEADPAVTAVRVRLRVVADACGADGAAPVRGAAAYLRWTADGQDVERRKITNRKGAAAFAEVPPGPIRIQVIAQGYRTFRRGARVERADLAICVPLVRFQD